MGYTYAGEPVTAEQICSAAGAMAALLKDALKPNLVQTLEHTPALVHGGPFANIAHGCNSVIATQHGPEAGGLLSSRRRASARTWARRSSWTSSAACPGIEPSAVVVVATVRALKHHGGCPKAELGVPRTLNALEARHARTWPRHVENMQSKFGMPVCVAINRLPHRQPPRSTSTCGTCAPGWACPAR